MTEEAGKNAAQWAQDSGVVQWAREKAGGVSAWAKETAQNVGSFIDEKSPEVNAWLSETGEQVAKTWKVFTKPFRGDEPVSDNTYFPETEAFVGTWQVDDCVLELSHESEDPAVLSCTITQYTDDAHAVRWFYDACVYDDIGKALSTFEIGTKTNLVFGDDDEIVSSEEIWSGGAARFAIDDAGRLVWTDCREAPGEDEMVFEKIVDE